MKKLMFVLAFALFGTAGLMAQETAKKACSKTAASSCCAKKSASAATTSTAMNTKVLSAAESRAEADASITKRVCAESGTVSFYKEEKCEKSGKISYKQVSFDAEKNEFVNVSPNDIGNASNGEMIKVSDMEEGATPDNAKKKACSKDGKAAGCCSKKEGKSGACCSKKPKTEEK